MAARLLRAALACAWHAAALAAVRGRGPAGALLSGAGSVGRASAALDLDLGLELHASTQEALEAASQNLTLDAALDIVEGHGSLPEPLDLLVQELRRASGSRSKSLRRQQPSGAPDGAKLGQVQQMLNSMIEEAMKKLDVEEVKCTEWKARQSELIEETRRDAVLFSSQAVGARGKILTAQAAIQQGDKNLPKLQSMLRVNEEKCRGDTASLEEQLRLVADDDGSLGRLAAGVSCEGAKGPALLQCGQGRQGEGRSFVAFESPELQQLAAGVRSPVAQEALQERLAQLFAGSEQPQRPLSLIARRLHAGRFGDKPLVPAAASNTSEDELSRAKQQRKCSTRSNPDCESVRDQLMVILSGVDDSASELKDKLGALKVSCESAAKLYTVQTADEEKLLRNAQTALAEASASQSASEEQSRLKNQQVTDLHEEFTKTSTQCQDSLRNFETEICGFRRVRAELLIMAGVDPLIQDCEVADWSPETCNATCGGGVQRLTRTVAALSSGGGATCPPLVMERRCNQKGCPIDCEVAAWALWSSCTAVCGGGVMERSRAVVVEPKFDGGSCGETSETRTCNTHSCDKDCELSPWRDWSTCSKMCDNGLMTRKRDVVHPVEGAGHCATADDQGRLEYKACNEQACVVAAGNETLHCNSKLDVLLLLDGSGSVGTEKWEAVKRASKLFVEAMPGGTEETKVGVMTFGGPRTWPQYVKCTEGPKSADEQPADMATDCGVEWVSRLTSDVPAVAQQISGLAWPGGSSLLSSALMAASAGLNGGRRDARSVVVVVTDAQLMSPRRIARAAIQVREQARLVWVAVTKYGSLKDIRQWASKPSEANVIRVDDYDTLAKNTTISSLISSLCPNVV